MVRLSQQSHTHTLNYIYESSTRSNEYDEQYIEVGNTIFANNNNHKKVLIRTDSIKHKWYWTKNGVGMHTSHPIWIIQFRAYDGSDDDNDGTVKLPFDSEKCCSFFSMHFFWSRWLLFFGWGWERRQKQIQSTRVFVVRRRNGLMSFTK